MKDVVEYLSNPLQTGVHYGQFTIDFSEIEQLFRHVGEIAKKHKSKEWRELIKTADALQERYLELHEIRKHLGDALECFIQFKECPREISQYVYGHETLVGFRKAIEHVGLREEDLGMMLLSRLKSRGIGIGTGIFEPHVFGDVNDVIVIGIEETTQKNTCWLEATTIKKEGMLRFLKFMKCIPHIADAIKEIRNRKTHSSRYTFRPYPLAVRLWLDHEEAINVFEDLRDFLRGSIRYYSEEEWRTSIVLSAIAVESVLADLYEENYKKYAPNEPLGGLYQKVKEKINFPSNIAEAIEKVNESRISAVHRSRFPVSDREATSALHGATTFIMWYSSNF